MSPDNRVQAYAKAFYEAVWERYLAAFDALADRLAHDPALAARLRAGDLAQRQRALDANLPADADAHVRNFMYTMLQNGDLDTLGEVAAALRERFQRSTEEIVEVEVTSAVPLTDQECQAVRARLESRFGTNLNMHYRVDPAILGGMIIRAGDQLIDGSVASRLADMRRAMGAAARE